MVRKHSVVTAVMLALLVAASAAAEKKFVASDVDATVNDPGRILITNDGRAVVAWQYHDGVRRSLVRIRSSRSSISMTPYGSVLFDSNAPMPEFVPEATAQLIRQAALAHGVDPRLVASVAYRESGFDPRAVARAGATGVMQLMPETAKFFGVSDIFDPRENIFAGVRYLKILLDTFRGDLDLTLAAYNAGPGAVERYRGVPPYKETLAYVSGVRRHYETFLN